MELSDFPALCANEKIGATQGPIVFKHLVPNRGIARSMAANERQLFVNDALEIGWLGVSSDRRSTDSGDTNRVQLYGSFYILIESVSQQLRLGSSRRYQLSTRVISTHIKLQLSTLKIFSGYDLLRLLSSVPVTAFQPRVTTVPSAITVNVFTFQQYHNSAPLSHQSSPVQLRSPSSPLYRLKYMWAVKCYNV